ncbi:MAG: hypothetical protein V3R81_15365 [Gammaproteobacteria bacterium]
MGMTVKELIKELKKHPPESEVGWRDHDASEDAITDRVKTVDEFDPETSFDPRFCEGVRVVLS